MALLEEMTSSGPVAILDAAVLRLIDQSLDGGWHPTSDPTLRSPVEAALVAAAQVRLYGDRERCGWFLLTTGAARRAVDSWTNGWSVGFVPALESFDDAPPAEEVNGQSSLFDKLDSDAATTLASALLTPAVTLIVTDDVGRYKHQRPNDLPDRLTLIDVSAAAQQLDIASAERPFIVIPSDEAVANAEPWWVPT